MWQTQSPLVTKNILHIKLGLPTFNLGGLWQLSVVDKCGFLKADLDNGINLFDRNGRYQIFHHRLSIFTVKHATSETRLKPIT